MLLFFHSQHSKHSQQQALEVSRPFTSEELETAVGQVHVGKAAGLDGMFPEFIKNFGPKAKTWLLTMFNDILATRVLPKAFKRSKVIAVLKPGKSQNWSIAIVLYHS